MRLLLHICCGPCATWPFQVLEEEGCEADGFFYNPNIHPFTEYLRRREAVEKLASATSRRVIFSPRYDFDEFFRRVASRESERCRFCYEQRLQEAARAAKQEGYEAFTTTLLISKRQDHELVKRIGEAAADGEGVGFLYRDFREGWKRHWELTAEYDLYKQQYCGCLYSEYDRFKGQVDRVDKLIS